MQLARPQLPDDALPSLVPLDALPDELLPPSLEPSARTTATPAATRRSTVDRFFIDKTGQREISTG
jgi:hypothetical protein